MTFQVDGPAWGEAKSVGKSFLQHQACFFDLEEIPWANIHRKSEREKSHFHFRQIWVEMKVARGCKGAHPGSIRSFNVYMISL